MFLACCRSPSVGIFLSPHFAELVGDARRFSFNDSQNALGHIAALDAFFGKCSLPVRALYLFAGWPGHVLYLKSELTEGRWRIYSDNITMARWLRLYKA